MRLYPALVLATSTPCPFICLPMDVATEVKFGPWKRWWLNNRRAASRIAPWNLGLAFLKSWDPHLQMKTHLAKEKQRVR
jgi:hypothetical protein